MIFDNCLVCMFETRRPRRMTCSDRCHDRWPQHSPRYWHIRYWVNLLFWSSLFIIVMFALMFVVAFILELIFMILPWVILPLLAWGVWGLIKGARSL